MVTITVEEDKSCSMARVDDGCGNCMEGNLWDFHNGCVGGLEHLGEFNNISEFILSLRKLHNGEEIEVVRINYKY